MNRKFQLCCAIAGILSCLLMIAAAIREDDFPRFLWLFAALGQLLNVAGILYSYRQHVKK